MTNNIPQPDPTNPHSFDDEFMDQLADVSSKMYDHFYDLLTAYQFGFSPEEKEWMLLRIADDIRKANRAGDTGDFE